MKNKPTFPEAIIWLLATHKNVAGAARWLGMTPQNLKRVIEDNGGGKALQRTREWVCFKVWEARMKA
jgi:hypothetical protein